MNDVNERWGIAVFVAGLAVTLLASIGAGIEIVEAARRAAEHGDWAAVGWHTLFAVIVAFLIYGNIVYQLTRQAHYSRMRAHRPTDLNRLRQLHREDAPGLAILVPTYKEEEMVVLQTLLSAALLEYPRKQVVLLIDDGGGTASASSSGNLERMRRLPERVQLLFRPAAILFERELRAFLADPHAANAMNGRRLAELCMLAAKHIVRIGAEVDAADHVSAFFRECITGRIVADLSASAARWQDAAPEACTARAVANELRRLLSYFSAEISSFERKAYANLSHAANKAMNLNAYLALMGTSVREVAKTDGSLHLVSCGPQEATRSFPDSDYVITLDADSLLLNDYALRLVEFLERPENARIAIAQTPYSAYPGAPGALECAAGITTDIQHVVHQGFTQYRSTYWVGANALIRKTALEDIGTTEREDGKIVRKFIQDRTVIEDTESSVDLWLKGWSLHNYPDRLAYSATPPDFGSLLIQRRRWANGGLIILPKLLRYVLRRPFSAKKLCCAPIQAHYLISVAASSSSVLILLLVPFEDDASTWWLPLTAAPYFLLYGLDMRLLGHRWSDLLRVYALNLALIPVHLGGVVSSLRQVITGKRASFGRTPKVSTRTAVPSIYLASVVALCGYCFGNAVFDVGAARWAHAVFALINGSFLAYAIAVFIGLPAVWEDLSRSLRRGRRPARPLVAASPMMIPAVVGHRLADHSDAKAPSAVAAD